jgi:hypothetical protein
VTGRTGVPFPAARIIAFINVPTFPACFSVA